MIRAIIVATVVLGFLFGQSAWACKCTDKSLEKKIAGAPFIFIGTKTSEQLNEDGRPSAVMRVVESFKGGLAVNSQVVVDVAKGTSCEAYSGQTFPVLVIAGGHDELSLSTSRCNVYLTEAISFEGETYEPSEELRSTLQKLRTEQVDGSN